MCYDYLTEPVQSPRMRYQRQRCIVITSSPKDVTRPPLSFIGRQNLVDFPVIPSYGECLVQSTAAY